jgi:hypothetical protein
MKHLLFVLLIPIFVSANGQNKYTKYLQDNTCTPGKYIQELYNDKDIIVMCERDHPEMTQYDFFFELASQKWFIQNVGTVILETATRSIQERLDYYLLSEKVSSSINEQRLIEICRNNSIWPLWEKHNLYSFLKRIRELNETLTPGERIRVLGADVPMDWEEIKSKSDYQNFRTSLNTRDEDMAQFVIDWHKNAIHTKAKSKALVVMNYRHAYGHTYWTPSSQSKAPNCYRYIKEAIPTLTTNIFLNRKTFSRLFSLPKKISKGEWDKAFDINNNQAIGLSLLTSPFGNDRFDDFPYCRHNLKWKDVFDHLVFYNPTEEFYFQFGVEGLVDDTFYPELKRRYQLIGSKLTHKKLKMFNGKTNSNQ